MNKQNIEILIVTRSIPLADGLGALLKAIPRIDEVKITRNFENAMEQIEYRKPQIVLVDAILLGNEPHALLERIILLSPQTQRVLIVDDVQAVTWAHQYSEAILIKGGSPSAVAKLVTNLLLEKGDEHEHHASNQ